MDKVLFSSKTDDYKTPKNIYDTFMDVGFIDCFPFRSYYDQRKINYKNKKLFINPPYSKLTDDTYIDYIFNQCTNNTVYLLVPARTDTKWFQRLCSLSPHLFFIKGRLKFNDSLGAPFPSVVMIFSEKFLHSKLYNCITVEEFISHLRYWYGKVKS